MEEGDAEGSELGVTDGVALGVAEGGPDGLAEGRPDGDSLGAISPSCVGAGVGTGSGVSSGIWGHPLLHSHKVTRQISTRSMTPPPGARIPVLF